MGLIKSLFGTTSEREIKKIKPLVDKVLSLEEEYSRLSDSELREKTNIFKSRLANGETLDDILPEAFATVREASWRTLRMKHFPVQIMGGIIIHQGRIAEMATGSGKTLVATLPAYLNALTGEGVYVITVNDYLAKRDSVWMGKIYSFLGLSVGLITTNIPPKDRKKAYACDITYGTNNEFGFDYLRDNMISSIDEKVQRSLKFAIIDEVDSVLIDEARTPLIISGFSEKSNEGYLTADKFVKKLKKLVIVEDDESSIDKITKTLEGKNNIDETKYGNADYVVEEKKKTAVLTEKGVAKAEAFYHVENLADPENVEINHYITRALKAYGIFKKDVDYVIRDGKVMIVDESTGRIMDGRRYSEGIHQAIEAKEGVDVQHESKTLATITFQNFFRKFEKLSGMTGTAKTEEEEFRNIYRLDVVEIPTHNPVQRIDKNDVVYITRKEKLNAIIERIKECHAKGQPILVGTVSVQKSEELSELLKKEKIKHKVLNAKYHEEEAKIVAQAGKFGSVTIATNMAGRGTDIILGGNPEYLALEELRKEEYPEELINEATGHSETTNADIINIRLVFAEKENRIKEELKEETEKVKAAGGLYILGSERHESRRIDNQLRGRSGRQGDVGVSEFILSLEDDLLRVFGGEKIQAMYQSLKVPENTPIDSKMLTKQIESCQRKIESIYYQQRKNVLEFDEVTSRQRDIIYEERAKIFTDIDFKEIFLKMSRTVIEESVEDCVPDKKHVQPCDIENLRETFEMYRCPIDLRKYVEVEKIDYEELYGYCISEIERIFETLYKTTTPEGFTAYAKKMLLFLIDSSWQEHLIAIDEIKQGSGLKAYAQTNPVDAFKKETFDMFYDMMDSMKREVLTNLMNIYHRVMSEIAAQMVINSKKQGRR